MEINYTEIDNFDEQNDFSFLDIDDNNTVQNKIIKTNENENKKQLSYDDILNSFNLKVNNGKLEYNSLPILKKGIQNQNQIETKKIVHFQQEELSPELKNSTIFNKYFKNYKDPNQIEQPIKIMTKEEYKQFLIQDYYNKKRISEIKSKKLLFSNSSNNISSCQPTNLNKFFNFSRK